MQIRLLLTYLSFPRPAAFKLFIAACTSWKIIESIKHNNFFPNIDFLV